jgi:hypothetical protein
VRALAGCGYARPSFARAVNREHPVDRCAGAVAPADGAPTYTLLNRRPPAEADFQRFFRVTPPTVHQVIVELERRGLITRIAGQPRTIQVTLRDDELPRLQPIKTTAGEVLARGENDDDRAACSRARTFDERPRPAADGNAAIS